MHPQYSVEAVVLGINRRDLLGEVRPRPAPRAHPSLGRRIRSAAVGAATCDLTTERHESDKSGGLCSDLCGTAGETLAVYPALQDLLDTLVELIYIHQIEIFLTFNFGESSW